jgi:LacI family transcriptional regulator
MWGLLRDRVTLSDIAQRAGVAASTVSRVLSGAKPVATGTRERVFEAVRVLEYQPNLHAQALARGRTMTIGVLTLDYRSFFGPMLEGVEEGLDGSGYRPVVTSMRSRLREPAEEVRSLDLLVAQRVDGLVVLGGRIADVELRRVAARLPLVTAMSDVGSTAGYMLDIDTREAAYRATRYLIGLGHRQIAHIAGLPGQPHTCARLAGFHQALTEAGLQARPELVVSGNFDEPSGKLAVDALLAGRARFSALFAANDQMAFGAMLALYAHGLRVPDDVSVVGLDDVRMSAYTTPPLTTVRFPAHAMGRAAAGIVLDLLAGRKPGPPAFATELVIRRSAVPPLPVGAH